MLRLSPCVGAGLVPLASLTWTVTSVVPALVGTPLSTPVMGCRLRLAGRLPPTTVHVYGGTPLSRSEFNNLPAPQSGPGYADAQGGYYAQPPAGAAYPVTPDYGTAAAPVPQTPPLAPDGYQAQHSQAQGARLDTVDITQVTPETTPGDSMQDVPYVDAQAPRGDAAFNRGPVAEAIPSADSAAMETPAIVQVQGLEEPDARGAVQPAVGTAAAAGTLNIKVPYANAPDHRWLQGRLEYSHVEAAWKLRYAPIDVENDPYGGSVVLGNDPRLNGFKEGDVVYVEGRVKPAAPGSFVSGARYELQRITRAPQR